MSRGSTPQRRKLFQTERVKRKTPRVCSGRTWAGSFRELGATQASQSAPEWLVTVEAIDTKGDAEVLQTLGVGRSRGRRRWLVRAAVLLVLGLLVAALLAWRSRRDPNLAQRWVTASAEIADLRETVTATGTLSPLDSVEVGGEVSGRVIQVHADINDPVRQGQVLVEIDPEQLNARVEEAQAQTLSAQASQRNAKATVQEAELKAARSRELHQRGLISNQDLEAAEAALARANASVSTAAAQVTVAQASLKAARTNLGKARVLSPIDGIVLARSVELGQTITAGFQTPVLFTLARDLTQMQLKVDVDEADVGKVRDGLLANFVVDAYPKRQFASKVLRLNNLPKAETTVITYEALLSVNNQERLLRPGMTATATIVTSESKNVLTVPNAALRFQPPAAGDASAAAPPRGGGIPMPGLGPNPYRRQRPSGNANGAPPRGANDSVYVLREGRPQRLVVELGASDGRRTEVRSPQLRAGSQVVVDVVEGKE